MSKRESYLLTLFALTAALLLGLWGYRSFTQYRETLKTDRQSAEIALKEAELYAASRETIRDEIDWLSAHEPEPQAGEQVATKLQQLASSEAMRANMKVKKMEILAERVDEAGAPRHYQVGQVKFSVSGEEKDLYSWFDRMHSPDDFRAISHLTMKPNREDDSKIDCEVIFDQWYVPLTPTM